MTAKLVAGTRAFRERPERRRRRAMARRHALSKLARRHPDDYLQLYASELEAVGLWPRMSPGPKPRPW